MGLVLCLTIPIGRGNRLKIGSVWVRIPSQAHARVTEWNRYPAQNRSFVGSTPTSGTFVVSRTTQWMDLTHPVSLLRENHAQAVHAHHGFMKVTHIPIISKSFPVGVVMESISLRLMVQILPAIKQQRSRTVKARQQDAQRVIWGHSDNGQHFCLASRESGFDSPWLHIIGSDTRRPGTGLQNLRQWVRHPPEPL